MSILDKIQEKTDFKILGEDESKIRSFTRRPVIRTPLKALDTIIGGGIPLGCICDMFGEPSSGKSSYSYEMLGNFQKQYPDGVGCIIDSESSVDDKRMRSLGVDPTKLLILRGASLESGYKQILQMLKLMKDEKPKDRVPMFILWDSLSNTSTDAQLAKESTTGGGISEAPRVNKEYLKMINAYLNDVDAIIVFINQVSAKIGMYVGSGYNEAGGNALKHNIQYKLEFSKLTTYYESGLANWGWGGVKIAKNKIGPLTQQFPLIIDITKGGVIDVARSFMEFIGTYCLEKTKNGRWTIPAAFFKKYPRFHQFIENAYTSYQYGKKFFWEPFKSVIAEDYQSGGIFLDFFILWWADYISERYTLQADVIAPYRAELIDTIEKYVDEHGWSKEYELPSFDEDASSSDDSSD